MYSIRNFLKQTPTAISTAVGTALTTISLVGWSPLNDRENLAIVGLVFVVLNLAYVAPLTSSNAKLQAYADAHEPDG